MIYQSEQPWPADVITVVGRRTFTLQLRAGVCTKCRHQRSDHGSGEDGKCIWTDMQSCVCREFVPPDPRAEAAAERWDRA